MNYGLLNKYWLAEVTVVACAVMMLNDRVQSVSRLQSTLSKAENYLLKLTPDTPFSEFAYV